ncbi:MAG: hypothetical protein V3T70_09305 [Phycisphaerae bacterium]
MRRLFSDIKQRRGVEAASLFLRRHRAELRRLVSRWTGENAYAVDQVLGEIIQRCSELKLRRVGAERPMVRDFAILLAVQTTHALYNRRFRIVM